MIRFVLVLLAGGICTLAWAPFELFPLVICSYGIFAGFLLKQKTIYGALRLAFAYSIGLHLSGHFWVFESLLERTQSGPFFAIVGFSIFLAYMCIFTALPAVLYVVLANSNWRQNQHSSSPQCRKFGPVFSSLLLASLFTLGEYLRSIFFNGFTSLSLGYAMIDTWAAGWIPMLGVYGASYLGFCSAVLLSHCFCNESYKHREIAFIGMLVCLTALFGFGLFFQQTSKVWIAPYGDAVSFRLIQANVNQSDKFSSSNLHSQINRYVDTITSSPATLILTPETAFPIRSSQVPGSVWERLHQFSATTDSHIFLGIPVSSSDDKAFNSILHIHPSSNQPNRYDKIRLMPFGEYSPLGFGWFTDRLSIALNDLNAGKLQQFPFIVPVQSSSSTVYIGSLICHEDLRGQELARWLPNSSILINPSNLSWFDGSIALSQGLQIVQARALESGRPILRIANTGITAYIDPFGKIASALPAGIAGELRGQVQPYLGTTSYARFGDSLILGVVSMTLLFAIGRL